MEVRATQETIKKINSLPDNFKRSIQKACREAARDALKISTREYLSGPHPEKLQAVSGNLRNSVQSMVESNGEIKVVLTAGNAITPYAAIHEFGGQAGRGGKVYIRPRPYLQPSIKRVYEWLGRRLLEIPKELIK